MLNEFSLLPPRRCIEKGMENMDIDVRVYWVKTYMSICGTRNTTRCFSFDRWVGSLVLWNVCSAEVWIIIIRSSWILACGHFQKWPKNQGIVLALESSNYSPIGFMLSSLIKSQASQAQVLRKSNWLIHESAMHYVMQNHWEFGHLIGNSMRNEIWSI